MTTYASIKAQIASLQAQAEEARAKELSDVVARIKADIAAYGITASDLGLPHLGRNGRGSRVRSKGEAKYRDPVSGKTWTGAGKPPNWIKDKDRTEFLISNQEAASEAPASKSGTRTASPRRSAAKPAKPAAKASRASKPAKTAAPVRGSRKKAATEQASA